MPVKKEIAIYIGTFDETKGEYGTYTWKKDDTFSSVKAGYSAFKKLCQKCSTYTYEDLMEIYDSPRLDIELRFGSKMLKWFGIYEKEMDADELDKSLE